MDASGRKRYCGKSGRLAGETAEFTLEGQRATVRCQVAPTHDALERVTGTFCLAVDVEKVDLREVVEHAAVA